MTGSVAVAAGAKDEPAAGPKDSRRIGMDSWMTGSFMAGLMTKARAGVDDDLIQEEFVADAGMQTSESYDAFMKNWAAELATSPADWGSAAGKDAKPSKSGPSLRRALWRTFKSQLLIAAAFKLLWGFFVLLSISYFVRELLSYIRFRFNDPVHTSAEAAAGIVLAFFFFVCTVLQSVALQQMTILSARVGQRLKVAIGTAVYRKSLKVDRYAPEAATLDVVSLVATDCSKLGEACTTLHYLWSGVVEALAIMCVLLGLTGVAALPGLGILLLLVPVQYAVGIAAAASRKKVVAASEARVRLMDEILRAVKLVKMYAWELKFAEAVSVLRGKETNLARIGGYLKSLNLALVFVLPPMIALGIFGLQTAMQGQLDPTLAFTTLSIFNTLRLPLVQLPKSLRAFAEAVSAAERIQAYLLAPEANPAAPVTANCAPVVKRTDVGITFKEACFTYAPGGDELLHDLTFNLKKGSLTMVAGPVASGKSNLVMAILGQMRCTKGASSVSGTFSYVPQTPWCAHGTVRDNILFGKPWNEVRYRRVIFACALERDLGLLDDGDLTEIGERGMNLSGGQKQRIALARAAYSGAEIMLLDSALSAVDMYTCTHIVTHLITGMLATEGTTVVLVTHQAELFHKADNLIVMGGGSALYAGPYDPNIVKIHFPNANATPSDVDTELVEAVTVAATPRVRATSGSAAPAPDHFVLSPVREVPTPSHEASVDEADSGSNSSKSADPSAPSSTAAPADTPVRSNSGRSTPVLRAQGGHPELIVRQSSSASRRSRDREDADHTAPTRPTSLSNARARGMSMDYDALSAAGGISHRALTLRGELLKGADEMGGPYAAGEEQEEGGPERPEKQISASRRRSISSRVSVRLTRGQSMSQAVMAKAMTVGPSADLPLVLPGTAEWEQRKKRAREAKALAAETVKITRGQKNSYLTFAIELRWYLILLSLAVFVITQVTRIFSDIWISLWTSNHYSARSVGQQWYLGVYGGYVAVFMCLLLTRGLVYYWIGLAAASRMHASMFKSILHAPMSFFTLTPLGQVLSVFSRDMDAIDEALLDNMQMVLIYVMILGTTIGVVIRVVPVFAAIAGVLLIASVLIFRYYLAASKVLKERAGLTSATVVAHVSETLQGLPVIKAYKAEERFQAHNVNLQDASQTAGYTLELLQLWLTFRQDLVGCGLVLATCMFCVALEERLSPAAAGLAVSNSFQILLFLSLMIRGAADVHSSMASVDRVSDLGKLQPEPDVPLTTDSKAKDGWPGRGEVDFHGVIMSYLPNAPFVLKGVNFTVQGCEKVGVVGRTGAGKSSLIMALLRLAPLAEGGIRIDGVDVGKLTLAELRKRVAIIPQEPVMFEGTLRSNLDPFSEHSDEDLIAALDKCLLSSLVNHPQGLQQRVEHMGENYSLGQQQLVCLCRALLNKSKLLLLDEATAALDTDTDAAVQRILRTAFADRTIITIAHRLDTIIDSDRILVMDAGRVAEFDSPSELLRTEGSIFAQLCKQTGAGSYASLVAAADRHVNAMRLLEEEVQLADVKRNSIMAANILGSVPAMGNSSPLSEVDEEEEETDEDEVKEQASDGSGSKKATGPVQAEAVTLVMQ